METQFDAFVTEALFDSEGAVFALGDGAIGWEDGRRTLAHDGATLCATVHPSGQGVISGGDDGQLIWSTRSQTDVLATVGRAWIDAVAANPASGLIAFASGKTVGVRDSASSTFQRSFSHAATVSALAFDAKGRRLAAATYGGMALWYARIADQKPVMLRWAGSHIAAQFSPDGKFLISSMQEAALHGWRLADAKDMRMGGYPAKVKSLAFLENGLWLATSGARGVVVWPFGGANGPMGKQALEIGVDEQALVTRIAADPIGASLAAGLDDGRIWTCDLRTSKIENRREPTGAPICALALAGDQLAWGDENGAAGVLRLDRP